MRTAATGLRFGVLGALEITRGDERIEIGSSKQRTLLAILLLHANQVVATDVVIEDLWSGAERPDDAAGNVQWHVARLRRVLGADAIETRPPGYMLRATDEQLDLTRFETLLGAASAALAAGDGAAASAASRDALALWRGAPLVDVAYEAFAQTPIARLEELRLVALETRARADLALGRHVEAIPELRQLVSAHPTREGLAAELMVALYRAGRQAEALDVYQATRHHLDEQLGLEPGAALQRVQRAVLAHDPGLDPPAREPEAPGGPAVASQPAAAPAPSRRAILVVAGAVDGVESLLEVAEPLARSRQPHELILARLLPAGDGGGLGAAVRNLAGVRGTLAERGVDVRVAAFTTEDRCADIVRTATEQDVDLLLMACPPGVVAGDPFPADLVRVLQDAPADVALVVSPAGAATGETGPGPIVTPFSGDGDDWASLELAAWLASATRADLRLVGVAGDPASGRRDASRLLSVASLAVQELAGVLAEPVIVEPTPAAVLATLDGAGLAVLALPADWAARGLGAFRTSVVRGAQVPVLLVRRGIRPGGLTPPAGLTRYSWSLAGHRAG